MVRVMDINGAEETPKGVQLITEYHGTIQIEESLEMLYNMVNNLEPYQSEYKDGSENE